MRALRTQIVSDFDAVIKTIPCLLVTNKSSKFQDMELNLKYTFHEIAFSLSEYTEYSVKFNNVVKAELDNKIYKINSENEYQLKIEKSWIALDISMDNGEIQQSKALVYYIVCFVEIKSGYFLEDNNQATHFDVLPIEVMQRIISKLNRIETMSLVNGCFGNVNQAMFANLIRDTDPTFYQEMSKVIELQSYSWLQIYLMIHTKRLFNKQVNKQVNKHTDKTLFYDNNMYCKVIVSKEYNQLYSLLESMESHINYSAITNKKILNLTDNPLFYMYKFHNGVDWYNIYSALKQDKIYEVINYIIMAYENLLGTGDNLLLELSNFNITKFLDNLDMDMITGENIIDFSVRINDHKFNQSKTAVNNVLKYLYTKSKFVNIDFTINNPDFMKWALGYDTESEIKNNNPVTIVLNENTLINWVQFYAKGDVMQRKIMDISIDLISSHYSDFNKQLFYVGAAICAKSIEAGCTCGNCGRIIH
jgi:hypothetical protein